MVFKRPASGRNDQSGRSSNRNPKAGERPKRASASKGNFSKDADKRDNERPRKYGGGPSAEKRSFPAERKPYQGGADRTDKPASSFRGSDARKPFSPKARPYSGRAADNDNPREGYGRKAGADSAGDHKSFAPKRRPYTGRPADNDERPRKSFSNDQRGGEFTGEKKPFTSRGKSAPQPFAGGDKPKRTFSKPGARDGGGFKKRDGERNFVSRERSKDTQPPARVMRGRKKAAEEPADDGLIRLNRYISNAGICSRRKADELIAAGVVSVNGEVVSELGYKVDPRKDVIRYNGETLKREKMVYVLLNKPKDYITTTEDPQERRTVMHLVEKASRERIYPIGRLDRNTTGLLLMTNDGDLADKLSHPRNNITKLYQVELNKSLTQGDLNKIGFGIELEDGLIKPDAISYVAGATKREVGIQIHSGKNRIVRRIFEHLGYEVVKLDRVVYANLTKKDLPRGRWRYLEENEVIQLKHLI